MDVLQEHLKENLLVWDFAAGFVSVFVSQWPLHLLRKPTENQSLFAMLIYFPERSVFLSLIKNFKSKIYQKSFNNLVMLSLQVDVSRAEHLGGGKIGSIDVQEMNAESIVKISFEDAASLSDKILILGLGMSMVIFYNLYTFEIQSFHRNMVPHDMFMCRIDCNCITLTIFTIFVKS